jgi:prepilin-type N-terminal cleavage/methylation domain-containing protein
MNATVPRLRARTATRGYTAVEVLMAMTVMVIGAAAVISMQKTSVTANFDARQTDVANAIARTWMERLQRDAMQWTCPGPACPSTGNNPQTALIVTSGNVTGAWFLPKQYLGVTTPESMSPGFDILGRDLPQTKLAPDSVSGWPGAAFCVNVRLSWLVAQSIPVEPGLVRADVRVLWPRGIVGGAPAAGFCDDTTAALVDPDSSAPQAQRPFFRSIYLTSALRETPAQ